MDGSACAQKKKCMCCSYAGGKGILIWLDRGLTLHWTVQIEIKVGFCQPQHIESFRFVMAFSSGWWDPIVSAAPISQGQWKSLGQQSRLLEGDGARFCQTEHVCAYVCVVRAEFYDADSKQEAERDIMLPTPVVNWGQSSSCRDCLQTCLCCKSLQSSGGLSLRAKGWRTATLDPSYSALI